MESCDKLRLGLVSLGGCGTVGSGSVRQREAGSGKAVTVRKSGYGAVRLVPVRSGKSRRFCSVLGWCGVLWSGQVGRGRIWLGGSGVLWT